MWVCRNGTKIVNKEEDIVMVCSKCGAQLADGTVFCPNCGNPTTAGAQPVYAVDPADHTAEFDAKDVSDNKVFAMLPYLMGIIGVIVALLASNESPYARFHVRQALKLDVVTILVGIVTALLCWTCIVPVVGGIASVALVVIRIICFFQVCKGQAKEPAIIKDLKILK